MVGNLSKWLTHGFNLLLKPSETASIIKKEKPTMKEGVFCLVVYSCLAGLLLYLVSRVIGITVAGFRYNISSASIFVEIILSSVILPMISLVLLLLAAAGLRLLSKILKGRSNFGEECGILGVLGCCYVTIFVISVVLLDIIASISFSFSLELYVSLFYFGVGLSCLLIMPLLGVATALASDLVADIEGFSFQKAGGIVGLIYGTLTFAVVLLFALLFFLVIIGVSALAMPATALTVAVSFFIMVLMNLIFAFCICFFVIPPFVLAVVYVINFMASRNKSSIYKAGATCGFIIGCILCVFAFLFALFLYVYMQSLASLYTYD
jgi:hypothetical protein